MNKRVIARLTDFSHVPAGSIYLGTGKVDFETGSNEHDYKIAELLAEFDDKGKEIFRKPGFVDVIKPRRK